MLGLLFIQKNNHFGIVRYCVETLRILSTIPVKVFPVETATTAAFDKDL
jgi:hypothetical protein